MLVRAHAMAPNRVFFPQAALDEWERDGRIELRDGELVVREEGRRYRMIEAARVVREVTGAEDVHDLTGRVKSAAFLTELGAELLGSSMLLGEHAYDIVPGWLGAPLPGPRPAAGEAGRGAEPRSDEELLGQYLVRTLGEGRS